jgi:hypothetical protein
LYSSSNMKKISTNISIIIANPAPIFESASQRG